MMFTFYIYPCGGGDPEVVENVYEFRFEESSFDSCKLLVLSVVDSEPTFYKLDYILEFRCYCIDNMFTEDLQEITRIYNLGE